MTHAILIAGHGSRDADGVAEFLDLARQFRAHRPEIPLEIGFLEFARPTIQEGMDRLARQGARTIVVLPGVLMAAGHAKNDMASEVRRARQRYPHLTIHMGSALAVMPQLLKLCDLRYRQALAGGPNVAAEDTLLLLVGRGSSDPDANANIAKIAHFLKEGYPAGWAAHAYSGIARPLLEEALPVCERAGFRRIVVQPYFLFTGVLLKKINALVEARRVARPDLDFVCTPHLQTHPLLLEAFAERAQEALQGTGNMNCSLCKYRVPILGHENAVGQPQEPHHHHVQGLHAHEHHLEEENGPHLWMGELVEQLRF